MWALSGLLSSDDPPEDPRSVRAFGAKGDGEHDDSEALQSAIDAGLSLLLFPAGLYRITKPLLLRSGQKWQGEGAAQSVLVYGADGLKPPINMLYAPPGTVLEQFTLQDIGIRGGRLRQSISSRSGQEGFGLYARGSVIGVTVRNCHFEQCGDGRSGGGGLVLGPRPEAVGALLVDVVIEGCRFVDNGNVPGVYLSAPAAAPDDPLLVNGRVRIHGNSFGGVVGSQTVQNSVYILGGGPQTPVLHVEISNNQFHYDSLVDSAIELNWCHGFTISENSLRYRVSMPQTAAILVRDGCQSGVISGNMVVAEAPQQGLSGISLLNFAHPGHIKQVVISNNVLSGLHTAVAIDRGATTVMASNNQISGPATPGSVAFRVIDAQAVSVQSNMVSDVGHGVLIGYGDRPQSGLRAVAITGNHFLRCGQGGAVIAAVLPVPERPDGVEHLLIAGNQLLDTHPGALLLDETVQRLLMPSPHENGER